MATPKKTSGFTPYKNTFITWIQHDLWLDGTPLSDSKNANVFNDVLFKRKVIDRKAYYFKRQIEFDTMQATQGGTGYSYNVQDFGITPQTNAEDNYKRFQYDLIDYVPQGYSLPIWIPEGRYEFEPETFLTGEGDYRGIGLKFDGKPFRVDGVGGFLGSPGDPIGSKLIFPVNSGGIFIAREASPHADMQISNIGIEAVGNKSIAWCSGIAARARINLTGVAIKGFSHCGVDIYADHPGRDASHSYILKCKVAECGNDGYYFGKQDANMITADHCDARDNGRYGFRDSSMLGCSFRDCMAHYNGINQEVGNHGADYMIEDWQNAHSVFDNCYSEGGNVNKNGVWHYSLFGQKTRVIGGTWGTGYRINDEGPELKGSYEPTMI